MGANFRITSRKKGGNLYLHLKGDFDGAAAMELIYAIKEKMGETETIFIETGDIAELLTFGRDVFQRNLAFAPARARKLIFIGSSGEAIAPQGACCQRYFDSQGFTAAGPVRSV